MWHQGSSWEWQGRSTPNPLLIYVSHLFHLSHFFTISNFLILLLFFFTCSLTSHSQWNLSFRSCSFFFHYSSPVCLLLRMPSIFQTCPLESFFCICDASLLRLYGHNVNASWFLSTLRNTTDCGARKKVATEQSCSKTIWNCWRWLHPSVKQHNIWEMCIYLQFLFCSVALVDSRMLSYHCVGFCCSF